MSKVRVLREFWSFLRVRKKFWLAPIVIILLTLGLFTALAAQYPVLHSIYAGLF